MTNKPKGDKSQWRTDFGMNKAKRQILCVSLRKWNATAAIPMIDALIYFFFIIPLLVIHLSAIETCIYVIQKLTLIGSTSSGFVQHTIHDFQNAVLTS